MRCGFCLALGVFAGCGGDGQARPETVRPVTVFVLRETEPSNEAALTGSAEPYRQEDLGFEVAGRVVGVRDVGTELLGASYDEQGELEKPGAVIATLDDTRYRLAVQRLEASVASAKSRLEAQRIDLQQVATSDVEQAEAQLEARRFDIEAAQEDVKAREAALTLAAEELRREKSLLGRGAGTQQAVDRAQKSYDSGLAERLKADASLEAKRSAYDAQVAVVKTTKGAIELKKAEVAATEAQVKELEQDLASANRDLADCTLHAPMNGRITKVHVARGAVVNAGQPVVTLTLMDPIKIAVAVSSDTDRDIAWGDPVQVRADGEDIVAVVFEKGEVADPATRAFRVDVMVRNRRRVVASDTEGTEGLPVVREFLPAISRYWGEGGTLYVPVKAILREGSKTFALRIPNLRDKRKVGRHEVEKVGIELADGHMTIVRWNFRALAPGSALEEGDLLVVNPKPEHAGGIRIGQHKWLIRPGDLLPVVFTLKSVPKGFYVPVDAVRALNDRTFVFVVEAGKVGKLEVTPGQSFGSLRRIESPELKPGLRIVVKGVHLLDDAEKVVVMGEERR